VAQAQTISAGSSTWVVLLRGVNVAGKNLLPMKDFAALLGSLGGEQVKTYVQSGNAVVRFGRSSAAGLAQRIGVTIYDTLGFRPYTAVLSLDEIAAAVAANPFPEAVPDPTSLHVFFLGAAPRAQDIKALEAKKSANERIALVGTNLYLHAPDGFAKSALARSVESQLSVNATARNWRTVSRLLEMAQAVQ